MGEEFVLADLVEYPEVVLTQLAGSMQLGNQVGLGLEWKFFVEVEWVGVPLGLIQESLGLGVVVLVLVPKPLFEQEA